MSIIMIENAISASATWCDFAITQRREGVRGSFFQVGLISDRFRIRLTCTEEEREREKKVIFEILIDEIRGETVNPHRFAKAAIKKKI